MHNTLENSEARPGKRKIGPVTLAIAAIAILAVAAGLWFSFSPAGKNARQPGAALLNMTRAEREYTEKIEIGNIAMSRAENFLHQEVTAITGEVYNSGAQAVSGLRLTMEFADTMNQIVLRETRPVLGSPEMPLAAGERRNFEISFEHVPDSWNMQQPVIRASYLRLPGQK